MVGITGLCGPVLDELLLANVCDHGWDTEQYISEVLVAGFEECERETSESCRKMFARARLALPCVAPRGVGDVCLVCRERVLGNDVGPCGYSLHSACLAEGLRVQVLSQQARMQVSRGSGLAEQQQRQSVSASVEPLPEYFGTLRTKATSDPFRLSSLVFGSSNDRWTQCGLLRVCH